MPFPSQFASRAELAYRGSAFWYYTADPEPNTFFLLPASAHKARPEIVLFAQSH